MQITKCTRAVTFVNPANPSQMFPISPTATVQEPGPASTRTVNVPITNLPSWLTTVDGQGNPTNAHLKLLVSDGTITLG